MGGLSSVAQTGTTETDASAGASRASDLTTAVSASITNSATATALEEVLDSQSAINSGLMSKTSAFDSGAPSATDRASSSNSDSEPNSGALTDELSTNSISAAGTLIVSVSGTHAPASSSGAASQSDSTSASTTFAQSEWAQPSDFSASLAGVMSQNNAIVYTIDVTIGDGGITLPVLVDTGSADIWIAASECENCTAASMVDSGLTLPVGCEEEDKGYGSGSVKGCLVNIDIIIGTYELEQFHVLAASDSQGFDGTYMSGIFGLAMNKSSINNQATPMDTLSQLGMISTPEVGFYLTRTESGSELVFGSPHNNPHADQNKKVTLPKITTGDGLYRVTMDGFVSHGYMVQSSNGSISMENIEVILDTGTSDIRVPEDMLLPIYAALGNGTYYFDTMTGDLVVPCNSNDDAALALQFHGQQFSLSWQDLIANPSSTDANYCYCRIQASPSDISDYLIVGSIFFHNIYHVINTDTGDTTLYGLVD
ncbi:endopeptidase [Cryptococcus neoformans]|uniref:Endopeptidase n=1 Tax=Cryptococcus neoformans Tu259-1 TaxID=1230072 RepID=A0A854QG21_CRYNE|nr:endopeptidase [Cryptococcus neoformans var. grubii AD1-83a]OXG23927.1 endopeptidase [Cryptococcus neoformans var. grubii Tu259-1]OXG36252.1 endopeptidase [Cryptococcus neoformans var. grubii Bt15]OXG48497.1 endopeptidase [Cryptococcus neoformans var. grubii Th84]OXG63266.1 endopeptidase [Cryptococcus neoformans var. grubii MW-RSA1955]OXG66204.1 endopeptidase [Cryptococcus neoformans var. grubii c8]OXG68280.1 endopeptidase [Cryptococcus neoformans var. grubii CHC193]OXG84111.1 endopeptidas